MTTHLIDIGNSKGISIPQNLIEKYKLENEIDIKQGKDGIFISRKRRARENWDEQIKKAILAGDKPDNDPIEDLKNEWDDTEWTWPE